jgi:hypothetical protein
MYNDFGGLARNKKKRIVDEGEIDGRWLRITAVLDT